MKKLLPIIIVGILVVSGLGAVAINNETNNDLNAKRTTELFKLEFSQPIIKENDMNYVEIYIDYSESYLMSPGQPMMPKVVQAFELEFGATNINVEMTPGNEREYEIVKEIIPAPVPVPLTPIENYNAKPAKDEEVYSSNALFPVTWCNYNVGCGLNSENKRVTHVIVNIYPVRYVPVDDKIFVIDSAQIKITYDKPSVTSFYPDLYDLVIIAPQEFSDLLQPLVTFKNSKNMRTFLKTTEEIYSEYSGADKPERIKYFIKDAIENYNITYVMLAGGLKSILYAKPRDDKNQGTSGWLVPVRYSNLEEGEPGYCCDLYYADIFKEGGEFDNWDSNGNGIYAERGSFNRDELDLYPDVSLGRLACRTTTEVEDVVNKIINYEQSPADSSWFNKIVAITGDGFLDQEDLNIQWDVNELPDGEYTIYAQSTNPDDVSGPIDVTNIKLDRSVATSLTFNHDDYLLIENFPNYPAPPIAKIVSVTDGDILGNTDYNYNPSEREAYCNRNTGWAKVEYRSGILHIRGKSYDPKPYGNETDIKVWIENSNGQTVFTAYRNNTNMYAEGDWTTGERLLHGRAGGLYYMPNDFEKISFFSSSGKFNDMDDVIQELSKGSGFVFFSGHGSPGWWGNHYPGIPGNRKIGEVEGLAVFNVDFYFPWIKKPLLPMNELTNDNKLPVVVVGGCHNSMFNVSLIPSIIDKTNKMYMHTYGRPTPECWSWYLVKLPEAGAIATMGNTGYGYGVLGEWCTVGGFDGWITTEFFRQYGEEYHHVLGDAYSQTLASYITHFKALGEWDSIHEKTVQQWVLFGDPSLKLGGV